MLPPVPAWHINIADWINVPASRQLQLDVLGYSGPGA